MCDSSNAKADAIEAALFRLLRDGDESIPAPESMGLDMELDEDAHAWLALHIAMWLTKHYEIKKKE